MPLEGVSAAVDPQPWTAETRSFVQNQQEDAYRALAARLGLGQDPKAAFAKFSRPKMPLSHASPDKFITEAKAAGLPIRPEDEQQIRANFTNYFNRFFSLDPPTAFEDPNRYPSMAITFDGVLTALDAQGKSLARRPLLATLPTGDVNAKIMFEPNTLTPIIFFEQALFRFFHEFAVVVGWAFPPISPLQLRDDGEIRRLPTRYTMPFQASEYFVETLCSYVVEGRIGEYKNPLQSAPHNLFLSNFLLQEMERFLMGHEVGHLALGHLDADGESDNRPDKYRQQEYEADQYGLDLMISLARANDSSWAVYAWACDLALTLCICLYRAIALMKFGTWEVSWVSASHPDPASRRARLREHVMRDRYSLKDKLFAKLYSRTSFDLLCSMTDAIVPRLLEFSTPPLFLAHERKVEPSPIWNRMIETCFRNR